MNKLTLEEVKQIQIELLDEVHRFCTQNKLRYFLSSGTLIGAVRHKGYIPWDDDLDLYMPRADYEKFIQSYQSNKYEVLSLQTQPSYVFPYMRLAKRNTLIIEEINPEHRLGINIDIFPVDGVPDNLYCRKAYFIFTRILLNLFFYTFNTNGKGAFFAKLSKIAVCFSTMMNGFLRRFSPTNTRSVCNVTWGVGLKGCFDSSSIEQDIDIEFEGKLYKTMIGYDDYLTKTYGNYMQLPPKEKQVTHHRFEAYEL